MNYITQWPHSRTLVERFCARTRLCGPPGAPRGEGIVCYRAQLRKPQNASPITMIQVLLTRVFMSVDLLYGCSGNLLYSMQVGPTSWWPAAAIVFIMYKAVVRIHGHASAHPGPAASTRCPLPSLHFSPSLSPSPAPSLRSSSVSLAVCPFLPLLCASVPSGFSASASRARAPQALLEFLGQTAS